MFTAMKKALLITMLLVGRSKERIKVFLHCIPIVRPCSLEIRVFRFTRTARRSREIEQMRVLYYNQLNLKTCVYEVKFEFTDLKVG